MRFQTRDFFPALAAHLGAGYARPSADWINGAVVVASAVPDGPGSEYAMLWVAVVPDEDGGLLVIVRGDDADGYEDILFEEYIPYEDGDDLDLGQLRDVIQDAHRVFESLVED